MSETYRDFLAERIRDQIPDDKVTRKAMFGSICFLVKGNLLCCAGKKGLFLRIDPATEQAALARPHVEPARPAGRHMPGFIRILPDGLTDDEALGGWIEQARAYVVPMPEKAAKSPKPRANAADRKAAVSRRR